MTEPREVLLVDDNPGDIDLTHDALSRSRFPTRVRSVADGVQAIAFLEQTGKYADACAPDLIILDLNLPRKDGRTVLSEVKANPRLKRTPVIIFSTSRAALDIRRSYELGANSYVSKPVNLQEYLAAIGAIGDFWLGCAHLPPREEL